MTDALKQLKAQYTIDNCVIVADSVMIDKMQMSQIKDDDNEELLYLRSKVNENQKKIANSIKIVIPNDVISQKL
ncbi:MAG TPA: hypothetical protein EYG85_12230 [Crocinitomix sp.]|nr:hypothetical protein [Crocinitomix sp.]